MMFASLWQTAQPMFSGEHIKLYLLILGGAIALVKFGAFLGDMNKGIKSATEEVKLLRGDIRDLTRTVGEHAKTFARVMGVADLVQDHEGRLVRLEKLLGG